MRRVTRELKVVTKEEKKVESSNPSEEADLNPRSRLRRPGRGARLSLFLKIPVLNYIIRQPVLANYLNDCSCKRRWACLKAPYGEVLKILKCFGLSR